LLQPLPEQHQARAIQRQDLRPIGSLGTEHKDRSGKRILPKRRAHKGGQPIGALVVPTTLQYNTLLYLLSGGCEEGNESGTTLSGGDDRCSSFRLRDRPAVKPSTRS